MDFELSQVDTLASFFFVSPPLVLALCPVSCGAACEAQLGSKMARRVALSTREKWKEEKGRRNRAGRCDEEMNPLFKGDGDGEKSRERKLRRRQQLGSREARYQDLQTKGTATARSPRESEADNQLKEWILLKCLLAQKVTSSNTIAVSQHIYDIFSVFKLFIDRFFSFYVVLVHLFTGIVMDKGWMFLPRQNEEYRKGLENFLDFAFSNANINGMIACPCARCKIGICVSKEDAYEHLMVDGFIKGYTHWVAHGEISCSAYSISSSVPSHDDVDDMEGLVHEAFGVQQHDGSTINTAGFEKDTDIPIGEVETFYKLIDDAQKELYPGCKKFSKLAFIIRLLHLKCLGKMANKIFNMLLDLLREAFPNAMKDLPKSYYEAEKLMKKLGLGYEKIDACPNDCTLYWRLDKDKVRCKTCNEPRWETSEDDPIGDKSKVACKVLWYFPIKPRLQRLFMSCKTAVHMRWHSESRTKDSYMRHPADSPAWQTFDHNHPEFAKDPRNIRLGLASDGFNPFKNMSMVHSTWPVILVTYNLPPWMCMKQPYFMLSLLIPGPSTPGNNIDIYLQPLIADLKDLWEVGVQTYDASTKQNFQLHVALLWTISDFPGYATLSGWSTKGKFACPVCHKFTHSRWLKNGKKYCYIVHRKFLNSDHEFRKDAQHFDGTEEYRRPPPILTGDIVINELKIFKFKFGKTVDDNQELPFNWKKMSIFFNLPYWKNNVIRHNLDLMHIEKNVCESICGTLLNMEGKTKDNIKSRLDLQEIGIRSALHPIEKGSGRVYLPPACYSMGKKEKSTFCKVLKKVKVPDGYASNISRCVQMKPAKLIGLKSHDNHILMQQLLPVALRKTLSKSVRNPLIRLCRYFRELCCKVISPTDVVRMRKDIVVILCQLEKIFPPSFFDIMIHLTVHLAIEVQLAGPVYYRWMYPIESEHRQILNLSHSGLPPHQIERMHSESFASWFAKHIEDTNLSQDEPISNHLKSLARGPNFIGIRYEKFISNGFRFHTKEVERKRKTQNCGVIVRATTSSYSSIRDQNPISSELDYYGILQNVIELDYEGGRKVILFECDWVSKGKRLKLDEDGFMLANFTNVKRHNEPYILASQAMQVFYVEDPVDCNWHVIITTDARGHYKMQPMADVDTYLQSCIGNPEDHNDH
ncbi:uncharacterized protein LOC122055220 [Zingiber officinale]|uniref:uncharacterized protein LOC122055220 n=1 Tax=Zingiber officinale TaxID=94328 RepID=UPI001C4D160F|nr:uncharacterized protein LOC122055220 [Zingiber officinale]